MLSTGSVCHQTSENFNQNKLLTFNSQIENKDLQDKDDDDAWEVDEEDEKGWKIANTVADADRASHFFDISKLDN